MSIPEQAGKVAHATIDALKTNPSCLVGLMFGCVMAILTYVNLRETQAQMHTREMALIDRCYPINTPAPGHGAKDRGIRP